MNLQIIEGNLLDATENLICHQVNCQGVMGSGLAKQLSDRYLGLYEKYKLHCKFGAIEDLLGSITFFEISRNRYIVNIFGQNEYGSNKKIVYTDYDALKKAFISLRDIAIKHEDSIAIPYNLGCGLGNGNWDKVYELIFEVFEDSDVIVNIYKIGG